VPTPADEPHPVSASAQANAVKIREEIVIRAIQCMFVPRLSKSRPRSAHEMIWGMTMARVRKSHRQPRYLIKSADRRLCVPASRRVCFSAFHRI